jgi:hypothetical protein
MAGESLQKSPPRMTITNVDTADFITAQFNPDELREKLVVNYRELEIMGLSHKPPQYVNTSNLALTFELGFDAKSVRQVDNNKGFTGTIESVAYARLFLMSLCLPKRGATNVNGGGPPRLLFSWPNMFSLTCIVKQLDFTHRSFSINLRSSFFVCAVQIDEIRDTRLTSEDVLSSGTLRSP